MSVIALVFMLIALLMVISAFFPGWAFASGAVLAPNRIVGLLIGLVVLYLVYLIVVALFGVGPSIAR